jgi:hypothetical protein
VLRRKGRTISLLVDVFEAISPPFGWGNRG